MSPTAIPSVKQLFGYFIIFQILTLMLVFWLTFFFNDQPEDENRNLTFIFLIILLVLIVAKFSASHRFSLYYVRSPCSPSWWPSSSSTGSFPR